MSKMDYIEADDYYDMACQWRVEKEWEKALTSLKHVIELNRYFIYAYIDLAAIYAVRKDFHAAVSVLKKAVKLDPRFDLLYYNLARYSYKCGDIPGAAKHIDEAISLNNSELYIKVRQVILKKLKFNKDV